MKINFPVTNNSARLLACIAFITVPTYDASAREWALECDEDYNQCGGSNLPNSCDNTDGMISEMGSLGGWSQGWYFIGANAWPQDWQETATVIGGLDSSYTDKVGKADISVWSGHGTGASSEPNGSWEIAMGHAHNTVCDATSPSSIKMGEQANDGFGNDGDNEYVVMDASCSAVEGELDQVWQNWGPGILMRSHQGLAFHDSPNDADDRLEEFVENVDDGDSNRSAWLDAGENCSLWACSNSPMVITFGSNSTDSSSRHNTETMRSPRTDPHPVGVDIIIGRLSIMVAANNYSGGYMKTHRTTNLVRALLSVTFAISFVSIDSALALDEKGRSEVKFNYQYERPKALGDMPNKVHMVVPAYESDQERIAAGKRKIERLTNALGIKMNAKQTVVKTNENKEVLRMKDERYRFKLYVPSGMIKFRDTSLYNLLAEKDGDRQAITEDQAQDNARNILDKLVKAQLVEKDQLLFEAARVSFRKERSAAGAEQDKKGRFQPGSMALADTRVFVSRGINGLGVSGDGVNVVLDKRGQLAGLDLFWRDLRQEKQALPVQAKMEDAKKRFEQSIKLPLGSQVNIFANELVYYDPSKRDAVAFLEPAYIFVYVTRVPIKGRRDEYRVSKVLHQTYPAVEHGRTQIPSERKRRLQAVSDKFKMEHPQRPEPGEANEAEGE